jgi:hypothetical protein
MVLPELTNAIEMLNSILTSIQKYEDMIGNMNENTSQNVMQYTSLAKFLE